MKTIIKLLQFIIIYALVTFVIAFMSGHEDEFAILLLIIAFFPLSLIFILPFVDFASAADTIAIILVSAFVVSVVILKSLEHLIPIYKQSSSQFKQNLFLSIAGVAIITFGISYYLSLPKLHDAIIANDPAKVHTFIERGADVNKLSDKGHAPLLTAIAMMDRYNNRYDGTGDAAISENIVVQLINAGANVNHQNDRGNTPLILATSSTKVMALLLANGADVNVENRRRQTALMKAAQLDNESFNLLIEAGADINAKDESGYTILQKVTQNGLANTVKRLLDAGADINLPYGSFALIVAACGHYNETMRLIIDAGADINATDSQGNTPLHRCMASRNVGTKSLEYLVEAGADINARNNKGQTPIHIAKTFGLAVFLIEAGADVNVKDDIGDTPLHVHSSSNILERLIAAGADINAQNNLGETRLYRSTAYYYPNPSVAKLLLEAGADWRIKTKSGHTALSAASTDEVAQLLRDYGAEF